jgi:HSP20 family protein
MLVGDFPDFWDNWKPFEPSLYKIVTTTDTSWFCISRRILESKDKYRVDLLAPGYDKDNFEVEVVGKTLKVSAKRNPDAIPEGYSLVHGILAFDNSSIAFEYTFIEAVSDEGVEAQYLGGVLSVTLNKVPKEKPKKVKVSGG